MNAYVSGKLPTQRRCLHRISISLQFGKRKIPRNPARHISLNGISISVENKSRVQQQEENHLTNFAFGDEKVAEMLNTIRNTMIHETLSSRMREKVFEQ